LFCSQHIELNSLKIVFAWIVFHMTHTFLQTNNE
jgi:hypothetical protein